jgi:hypothetical protein
MPELPRSGLSKGKRRCSEMESGTGLKVHFDSRRRGHLIFAQDLSLSLRVRYADRHR